MRAGITVASRAPSRGGMRRRLHAMPVAAALVIAVIAVVVRIATLPGGNGWIDTYAYLDAAHALLHAPSHIYDSAREQLTNPTAQRAFLYPPSALIPFVALQPVEAIAGVRGAAAAWVCLDTAALLGAVWMMSERLSRGVRGVLMLIIVCTGPVLLDINSGQVNGVLLLLTALAWRDRHRPRGTLWLGCAVALKPVAPLLLMVPVLRGDLRGSAVALGVAVGVNVVLVPVIGVTPALFYATRFLPYIGSVVMPDINNFSLAHLLWSVSTHHLLDAQNVAVAERGIPGDVAVAAILARGVVLAGAAVAIRRSTSTRAAIAVALASGPLIASTVWASYFVLAVPALIIGLERLSPRHSRALLVALVLLGCNGLLGGMWIPPELGHGAEFWALYVHDLLFVAAVWVGVLVLALHVGAGSEAAEARVAA